MNTTTIYKKLHTANSLDEWVDARNDLRAKAATHLNTLRESTEDLLAFYCDNLEYSLEEAQSAIEDNRTAYNMLKRDGWKTSEIVSVRNCV